MVTTYLALGSNLENPPERIQEAIERLRVPGLAPLRRARLYVSKPVGPQDQPDFVNTVLEAETSLAPLDLLDLAQEVENRMRRIKTRHWGPRTIDIDIALYSDVVWQDDRLHIPHLRLSERTFVLRPLAELAPDLRVPGLSRTVAELSADCREPPIEALDGGPDPLQVVSS